MTRHVTHPTNARPAPQLGGHDGQAGDDAARLGRARREEDDAAPQGVHAGELVQRGASHLVVRLQCHVYGQQCQPQQAEGR